MEKDKNIRLGEPVSWLRFKSSMLSVDKPIHLFHTTILLTRRCHLPLLRYRTVGGYYGMDM
jgi:hypothetical protein